MLSDPCTFLHSGFPLVFLFCALSLIVFHTGRTHLILFLSVQGIHTLVSTAWKQLFITFAISFSSSHTFPFIFSLLKPLLCFSLSLTHLQNTLFRLILHLSVTSYLKSNLSSLYIHFFHICTFPTNLTSPLVPPFFLLILASPHLMLNQCIKIMRLHL